MPTNDCAAHQCGLCGRFVAKASVAHRGPEQWAVGSCGQHGTVDVWCSRIGKRTATKEPS